MKSRAPVPRAKMSRPTARRRNPSYDEEAYARIMEDRPFGAPPLDLQRANLEGADLTGMLAARLQRANLRSANLKNAKIGKEALLRRTDFSNAKLGGIRVGEGATFERANFSDADLEGANLDGVRFPEANLQRANLSGASLSGAELYKTHLVAARMLSTNLSGADLRSANLRNANLDGSLLIRANLLRADLSGANLRNAQILGATLMMADLAGTDLIGADFAWSDMSYVNLKGANLAGKVFSGVNLSHANLENANLHGANLRGVKLREAHLVGADLRNADLTGANLEGANLRNANLEGANLEGANLEGANIEGTILDVPPPNRPSRSFGRQTGSVLKMGKADAPTKAADFKKKYPAEFERLKGDTQGRDFSEPLRAQVRQKYETPFVWLVTDGTYGSDAQRICPDPNLVLKFNINPRDPGFTDRQREFLTKLAETSRRSGHPYEKRLFTVGWVRICVSDVAETWLVEEVQSDVGVVREKLTEGSAPPGLEQYADIVEEMRPYLDRFYEDALGVVFMEAEKRGYAVEMLTYETKKLMGSPRSVYTDLPRSMGMQKHRKGSKTLSTLETPNFPEFPSPREVWYYKPNPRSSSRSSPRSSSRSSRGARSTRKPKGQR